MLVPLFQAPVGQGSLRHFQGQAMTLVWVWLPTWKALSPNLCSDSALNRSCLCLSPQRTEVMAIVLNQPC